MTLPAVFARSLAELGLEPGAVIVALSGGTDSVALLSLLHETRELHGHPLIAAHLDHGIHPDSRRAASLAAELAHTNGIRFVSTRLELGPEASEATARAARYEWLEQVRKEQGARWIFTAHHADDQAETILLRFFHGSGTSGLAGMAPRTGAIIRPLLGARRADLLRYVAERGLPSWEDPANRDPRHARSWLRHAVLPLLEQRWPDIGRRVRRVGRHAARERAAWDLVLESLPGLDWRAEHEGASVAASPVAGYDSPLGMAILAAIVRRSGGVLGPVQARRVLEALRHAQSGASLELPGGFRFERRFDRLHLIVPERRRRQLPAPDLTLSGASGEAAWRGWRVAWRREPAPSRQERAGWVAWFEPASVTVRGWRAGDRILPLGGVGRRLAVRCFQDAKVPRADRTDWPLLEVAGELAWIPGVCRSGGMLPTPGAEAIRIDVARD